MATVLTAPAPYDRGAHPGHSVFLAGAIDMGAAVDWQADVIARLTSYAPLVLLNPRRAHFTPAMLDEQVRWELAMLEQADTILMWLPKDASAPVSLFEAGLYWRSGKLLLGAEPGFYRRRNLELTGALYGVTVYTALDHLLAAVVARIAP